MRVYEQGRRFDVYFLGRSRTLQRETISRARCHSVRWPNCSTHQPQPNGDSTRLNDEDALHTLHNSHYRNYFSRIPAHFRRSLDYSCHSVYVCARARSDICPRPHHSARAPTRARSFLRVRSGCARRDGTPWVRKGRGIRIGQTNIVFLKK